MMGLSEEIACNDFRKRVKQKRNKYCIKMEIKNTFCGSPVATHLYCSSLILLSNKSQ